LVRVTNPTEEQLACTAAPIIPTMEVVYQLANVTTLDTTTFDQQIFINQNSLGYARIRGDHSQFHPGDKDNFFWLRFLWDSVVRLFT
jgi:hypothetical protein